MSIRNLFPQFIAVIAALAIPAGAAENGGAALREFLTAFFSRRRGFMRRTRIS